MPNWTKPFSLPEISDDSFREKQRAYVKKYGYRYSIPGFDDIFHLGFEKPMTVDEDIIWKLKKFDELPAGRYEELKYLKEQKRNRYLDLLGSPQPEVFQNRGSILSSIDDAQDAMGVAACLGSVLAKTLPKALGKAVLGPIGWLAGAAELLSLSMSYITPERRLIQEKRIRDELTDENPFSKKARLKRANKLSKAHFGYGKLIEAGQVTKDVFGYGISLGGVMNVPLDIITGAVRRTLGQKVTVKYPVPNIKIWQKRILKGLKALVLTQNMGSNPRSEEYSSELILSNLGPQCISPYLSSWNPIDQVDDIASVESEAPTPTNILSLEVIEEEDPDGINAIGWPTTGQRWSKIYDIIDTSHQQTTEKFQEYCQNNKHNWKGFVSATNAVEGMFYSMDALEEKGQLEYDYTTMCKVTHSLLNANYHFPQDLSSGQGRCFADFVQSYDDQGICPSTYDCILYAKRYCGFEFIAGPL